MKTEIIIKLQVPGIHCWKDCPIPQVSFLKSLHRHIFHITARKSVNHDDRETEIIMFKAQMEQYFRNTFEWTGVAYMFGLMSCEQLAKQLCKHFGLTYCEVLEDGENGAAVFHD